MGYMRELHGYSGQYYHGHHGKGYNYDGINLLLRLHDGKLLKFHSNVMVTCLFNVSCYIIFQHKALDQD